MFWSCCTFSRISLQMQSTKRTIFLVLPDRFWCLFFSIMSSETLSQWRTVLKAWWVKWCLILEGLVTRLKGSYKEKLLGFRWFFTFKWNEWDIFWGVFTCMVGIWFDLCTHLYMWNDTARCGCLMCNRNGYIIHWIWDCLTLRNTLFLCHK